MDICDTRNKLANLCYVLAFLVLAGLLTAASSSSLTHIATSDPWSQLGGDIDGEAAHDLSGHAVSLSSDGSRVAIGALFNDGSDVDAGHVRVYEWSGAAWMQVGADLDGEAASDYSGHAVSLSSDGSRVAIGARLNDGSGPNAGHVRVYEWDDALWTQVGADIDGEAAGDQSGHSVSLSTDGGRVAIGAPKNGGSGADAGHVRVYEWNGIAWMQVGMDIDGEAAGDYSGHAVSLSSDGSRVAIGALYNDGSGAAAGHVRVFAWNGAAWMQVGADIDGEAAGDYSSHAVSLSSDGSRVAIGAPGNEGSGAAAGHVRVYEWSGVAWMQVGADIDGEAAGDYSGHAVSLSSDGSRVAIGAPSNDGGTAVHAGHVRVYEWNGVAWTQVGADIDGEAVGDRSGWSVSLSTDGSCVAIGAINRNSAAIGAGYVRAFTAPSPQLSVTLSYFSATRNGERVDLWWQTAAENGTAGFIPLSVVDDEILPLCDTVIPSPVIDSVMPVDYRFGAASDATVFFLDEVDIFGVRKRYGPFNLGTVYGAYIEPVDLGDSNEEQSFFLPLINR